MAPRLPLMGCAMVMTNPAGAAIVNTVGPIRQVVEVSAPESRRYLVIAPGTPERRDNPCSCKYLEVNLDRSSK